MRTNPAALVMPSSGLHCNSSDSTLVDWDQVVAAEGIRIRIRTLFSFSCGHVVGTEFHGSKNRRPFIACELALSGGRARDRSADLTLFRRALYQLSYPTGYPDTNVMETDRIWWRT